MLGEPKSAWLPKVRERAIAAMMAMIRDDLACLGIRHDVFFSERSLTSGAKDEIADTIETLKAQGLIYEGRLAPPKGKLPDDWEDREQTLFRATAFGDDTDRALVKSDGSYTYFAADMAYHRSKIERGFKTLINVLGADHGGYVKRLTAAVKALSNGEAELDAKVCQLVRLFRGGEPVKMSKRSGSFVTLREVVDEVGPGPVRFMMLTRKNDAALDFDFDKVLEQSNDNPVFYVQYAHARASSVLGKAHEAFPGMDLGADSLARANLALLTDSAELALIKKLAQFPRAVEAAAEAHEPHRIAFYAQETAAVFHSLWTRGKESPHLRFMISASWDITNARLALITGVARVLRSSLNLLGVKQSPKCVSPADLLSQVEGISSMSTNDNSASRRGRRNDQAERRPSRQERDERWEQSSLRDRAGANGFQDQGRDAQGQRGYSNYRQSYAPPEPPAPPAPKQQAYYPEPAPRNDPPVPRFVEPAAPAYAPSPAPHYEPEPPSLDYRGGGRDDLFSRDPSPSAYEPNAFGSQGGYEGDPYDPTGGRQPMTQPVVGRRDEAPYQQREPQPAAGRRDEAPYQQREPLPSPIDDYERSFSARIEEEAQPARFYLADDEPQKQRARQQERAYPPQPQQQQYAANPFASQNGYDAPYGGQQGWSEDQPLHQEEERGGMLAPGSHGDIDEDYFADEDDDADHVPAPKRSRKVLIAAALAGAIAIGGGGAFLYKSLKGGGGDAAPPILRADSRPLKETPGNPGGKQFPNGEKTIYDRLTPDGQQIQAASFAAPPPAAQPFAAAPAPANSLEDRIDEALRKAQRSGETPPPPASAPRGSDQPTVVRSEIYRPDGSRVNSDRPVVMPSVIDVSGGSLPAPFGAASPPPAPAQPQLAAPFRTASAPAPAPVQRASPATRTASITPVEAAAPAGGFYVSLKSSSDEKAIQRDIPTLTGKYKSVLGDVQVRSKIADLGAKGVTYRAVAGPLGTRQEAMELCQKIKSAGGSCFVTN